MVNSRIQISTFNATIISKNWPKFYSSKDNLQLNKNTTASINKDKHGGRANQNPIQLFTFIKKLPPALSQKLYQSLPGGANTAKSILRFLISATSNDLTKAFPENIYNSAQKALSQAEKKKWRDGEKQWLQNNPLTVKDASKNTWKMYHLPWWQHNALSAMRLFYQVKKKQKQLNKNKSNLGNRFVLELLFSHIGPLQIEGLVQDLERKIWVLVRSEHALEPEFQNELRTFFVQTLASSSWQAIINFQSVPGYIPTVSGVSGETNKLI